MKNYYDILGISIWATEEEIKKSYRKLAFKFHPDYNQGDKFFEDRFRDIQEAYEILTNREKKIQYDIKLHSILYPPKQTQQTTTNYTPKTEPKENNYYSYSTSTQSKQEPPKETKKVKKVSAIDSIISTLKDVVVGLLSFVINIIVVIGSRLLVLGIFGGIIFGLSKACDSNTTKQQENNIANGNLDNSFKNPTDEAGNTSPSLTPEEQYQSQKQQLIAQGWSENNISNGVMSSCYNFKPKYGKLKNYLAISVGSNTNVAIKLMDQNTNKCVRYVYINANSSYRIKNIPEGIYYLKIAYGSDWISHIENRKCVGKFLRGSLYKRGDDVLDFYRKNTYEGYSIPSFSLQLDVVASDYSNQFDSQSITENDFNN